MAATRHLISGPSAALAMTLAWLHVAEAAGPPTCMESELGRWSTEAPARIGPSAFPQIVSVTFDDNFGLIDRNTVGGVPALVDFYATRRNPAGTGDPLNFDGAPIRATFFDTTIYIAPPSATVLGGKAGQDHDGLNLAGWRAAFAAGHEMADHTVNHRNGGSQPHGDADCCRARNFDEAGWRAEIETSRAMLGATGVAPGRVIGFRAPYLSYNDALFDTLSGLEFRYDSSLPNCFGADQDGSNCSFPYRLDHGSPDVLSLSHFAVGPDTALKFPPVGPHPGLWELPPTTLIVPPDSVAGRYGFAPGMRDRLIARQTIDPDQPGRATNAKLFGMDYTMLIDGQISGDEMRAVLEYNLDLHLAGNRSPMIFVAHSHLYAFSTPQDNPDTPSLAARDERWKGLTDFIDYALTKPEVRIVAAEDVIDWMTRLTAKACAGR